ncbi:MAG TPA: WbqC family protein [Moheibacter sp.]|nr:WbqC family protein [Moheibacter sp.]
MTFPLFYFGPVSYFAALNQAKDFSFERQENFPKQTYRNRCYIHGANGKLRLGIPIVHDGTRKFKDLKVSKDFNWQKEHFKSIESAYRSSPYFEYYEDEIRPIFDQKLAFLWDINWMTFELINQKLKLNLNVQFTEHYLEVPMEEDFRTQFNPKIHPDQNLFPKYSQVFEEKFDFLPDLSILDLLCNEGPHSATYLENLLIKP